LTNRLIAQAPGLMVKQADVITWKERLQALQR
jgi:hypothetical protein